MYSNLDLFKYVNILFLPFPTADVRKKTTKRNVIYFLVFSVYRKAFKAMCK